MKPYTAVSFGLAFLCVWLPVSASGARQLLGLAGSDTPTSAFVRREAAKAKGTYGNPFSKDELASKMPDNFKVAFIADTDLSSTG